MLLDQTKGPLDSSQRSFYGWWIVLGGTAILFVSSGLGFYGHGAILDALRAQYGWSKATISSAITMYFAISGAMGLIVGQLIDRHGVKPLLILGSTIIGIGYLLLSRVTELWQFYAVYVLMAVGWSGTSLIPITTLISTWFFRRRGFAMGLTMTGLSLGGMVLVPFSVYLTAHFGLRIALPILGAIFWVFVIPTTLFIIKQSPSDLGQFPDGDRPQTRLEPRTDSRKPRSSTIRVWTRREAMGTGAFWSIVIAFFLALNGQIAFLVHQVSFLGETLGTTGAAWAVSITAGASIIGRLFLGPMADRMDKRFLTMGCFFIQALAILAMANFRQITILYLGTFAFGLTMGGVVMMHPLLIGECFGMGSFGAISGLSGLFTVSGGAMGPLIAGLLFDGTQDYKIAFTLFSGASLLAMGAVYFARPVRSKGLRCKV